MKKCLIVFTDSIIWERPEELGGRTISLGNPFATERVLSEYSMEEIKACYLYLNWLISHYRDNGVHDFNRFRDKMGIRHPFLMIDTFMYSITLILMEDEYWNYLLKSNPLEKTGTDPIKVAPLR
jgi:hypothetical protein